MRRWNGWGDDAHPAELKTGATNMLIERVGRSEPPLDAELEDVLAAIPSSRLPASPLLSSGMISTDAEQRLRHAVGQSYPDWLKLRYGRIERYPDGVAFPASGEDVRALLDYADANDIRVIPYGGGTSVVGHLTVPEGEQPVLSVDMGKMNRLMDLNTDSQIARIGAGAAGPDIEKQLAERGYTLGHYPQSWEYSTVGGWVVTRSSGQQSLRYGRIENMFAGGTVETPTGQWSIPAIPATGAGTDVREMVLGSEGRIGILTEALMRVTPQPEHESFHVVFFPSWEQGQRAVKALAQIKLPLSMLRLSNAVETETQLMIAGAETMIKGLEAYLSIRGCDDKKVMMAYGLTGRAADCKYAKSQVLKICGVENGINVGTIVGKQWEKNRFHGPYFRNALWDAGYGADTVETSVNWDQVEPTMLALEQAARDAQEEFGGQVHAFTHLSHVYPQGSSVYSTFLFKAGLGYEEDLRRWQHMKHKLCETIVAHGGTISHQHGVGTDHAPYLEAEKHARGLAAIKNLFEHMDPKGLMNPGKLVP